MEVTDFKKFLPLVRRPSRYIGGEVNSVKKDLKTVALRYALAFPDCYEVGMSHLGMQILYQALNAEDDIACERVFAPWTDMEELLREKGFPLTSLESGLTLQKFDIIGFSLQYELSYTNVLNMLELGGVDLLAAERGEDAPFVFGGGPLTCNPEPVAPFFEAFLLGDGEEAAIEMAALVLEGRKKGLLRKDILKALARVKGVYVPSFFDVTYNKDNTIREIRPLFPESGEVERRIVMDMDRYKPVRPIVPFTETVHDRVTVEINRGCTRGCRFCQAGMIYRPIRERSPAVVMEIIEKALVNTGYDDVSLLSLSAGDYSAIEPLLQGLMKGFVHQRIALSLPSLRVGTLGAGLASEIKKVRKTGFTLAPEAGTERLRKVINKGISEEDLLQAVREVFGLGWKSIKLYFMIGLPTETEKDVLEIAELAGRVKRAAKEVRKHAKGGVRISVSVSSFIPKPFTPFQWEPQVPVEELRRLQGVLRKRLRGQSIDFKWHDPEMSRLEGIFARGDRRCAPVIMRAYKKGCRFDGWGEKFNYTLWEEALLEEGLDGDFYTARKRDLSEAFPWDHLSTGVEKGFLYDQYQRSMKAEETPDCKDAACSLCGVCDHKEVKNIIRDEPVPEAAPARVRVRENLPSYKVKLGFRKQGSLRFLGHLELVKVIKRLVRRTGFTVKYSSGFHPMPKLSFSPPIPLGTESLDESMEMTLLGAPISMEEIITRLNRESPEGLEFFAPRREPLKIDSGSDMIDKIEYCVNFEEPLCGFDIDSDRIDGYIKDFASSKTFPAVIKKGEKSRSVDIKGQVRELRRLEGLKVRLVLAGGEGPAIRPRDVLVHVFHIPLPEVPLIPILKIRSFR
ncbi:MAG: TIGR03960 family B12-binding radical SAM protein [Thermodesulfobacteriota bacterium]